MKTEAEILKYLNISEKYNDNGDSDIYSCYEIISFGSHEKSYHWNSILKAKAILKLCRAP